MIKQARNLNCDVDSKQFQDALRCVWMPRLIERIQPPLPIPSELTHGPAHIATSQLGPNPTAQAQHEFHGSLELNAPLDSEHHVWGACHCFNGNSTLPLGGGDLMESLWDDLEIKHNFLA